MNEILPENIPTIHLELLIANAYLWLLEHFLNTNTLYQVAIIFTAFIFSILVYRLSKKRTRGMIEKAEMRYRYKRAAYNIHKLLLPAIALVTIFFITRVAGSEMVGMNVWLIQGIMKALLAWIGIRVMVQLIDNATVRNTLATTIWIAAALSIFGVLDDTTAMLDGFSFTIGEFRISLFLIIKSAFYLFTLIYFAIFVAGRIERQVSKSATLTRSSKVLIGKILRLTLVGIALILGLISSGIDLSLFAVFGGAIGLGVGFGLQRGVSNLFSGMMLLLDRSIELGDVIELEGGTFGWVEKMGARYAEIVTRENKTYLIPNEELVTQRVVNWSHGDNEIRIGIEFGVHYKSDVHKVIEIAKAAAVTPERVLDTHEPVCWITGFGDSSVDFSLRFWISDAHNGLTNVKGEVFLALWDAFKEHGIEIPYPHREVYIHQAE